MACAGRFRCGHRGRRPHRPLAACAGAGGAGTRAVARNRAGPGNGRCGGGRTRLQAKRTAGLQPLRRAAGPPAARQAPIRPALARVPALPRLRPCQCGKPRRRGGGLMRPRMPGDPWRVRAGFSTGKERCVPLLPCGRERQGWPPGGSGRVCKQASPERSGDGFAPPGSASSPGCICTGFHRRPRIPGHAPTCGGRDGLGRDAGKAWKRAPGPAIAGGAGCGSRRLRGHAPSASARSAAPSTRCTVHSFIGRAPRLR